MFIKNFNFCFGSIALSNCFEFSPFVPFFLFGSFFEEGVTFKNFLGPTNVDKQL